MVLNLNLRSKKVVCSLAGSAAVVDSTDRRFKLVGSLFSAAAALYVAEIVKEAAKESWKNRAKVVALVVGATNKVKSFAANIVRLKRKLPERTEVVLALPIPND